MAEAHDGEGVTSPADLCATRGLHTYSVPVEGEPNARQCVGCGSRQPKYVAPTGPSAKERHAALVQDRMEMLGKIVVPLLFLPA